jgi:hypothetical protein
MYKTYIAESLEDIEYIMAWCSSTGRVFPYSRSTMKLFWDERGRFYGDAGGVVTLTPHG